MKKNIIYFFLLGILFSACEDPISLDLKQKENFVVIDAFINNLPGKQVVRLSTSTPYLSDNTPTPLTGATVVLEDSTLGRIFHFTENTSGEYVFEPSMGDSIGVIGHQYRLTVSSGGNTWRASDTWNRSTRIDSIDTKYKEGTMGGKSGYIAQFLAFDSTGKKDYYWIKAFKNGVFWNKPSQINLCIDGAYGNGGDGLFFILPIARAITPSGERYQVNDVVRVEIHGVSEQTYNYLNMAKEQMTNSGLFATTPENVSSNFIKITNQTGQKALGWFSVASVQAKERTVTP